MTTWTSDELNKIGTAEELEIASLRRDGTLRNPVTIWVVRLGDDLYVRSVNGRNAPGSVALRCATKAGSRLAASTKTSPSWTTGPGINDQIDAAYRTKYRRYSQYVPPVVTLEARAATIKLVPRPTSSA